MSRWLVGSSRKSRFLGSRRSFASASRDRSPPEKPLTTRRGSSPQKRKRARYCRAASTVKSPRTRRTLSTAVSPGSTSPEVLIEVALLQVRPALDRPSILGASASGEELEQRGLAGAVRTDDADSLAAPDEQIDAREEHAPAALGAEPLRVEDDVARPRRGRKPERDALGRQPTRPPGARADRACRASCGGSAPASIFCPAMFLRMNSSVFATIACCRSASARSRARSSSRATTYSE